MKKAAYAIAAVGLAAALAGCSANESSDDPYASYTQRIMTVSPRAGDTQAANLAIQTIDPWPRYVHNTRIPGNGKRMVKAVQDYENGANTPAASSTTATGAAMTP